MGSPTTLNKRLDLIANRHLDCLSVSTLHAAHQTFGGVHGDGEHYLHQGVADIPVRSFVHPDELRTRRYRFLEVLPPSNDTSITGPMIWAILPVLGIEAGFMTSFNETAKLPSLLNIKPVNEQVSDLQ